MDIRYAVMYGDVLFGDVKTFHFHAFMWVDPDVWSVIHLHQISLLDERLFSFKSVELLTAFDLRDQIWMIFDKKVEFMMPVKRHLICFELKAVKRCLTLVELLNTGMQLPGDVWTKLSSRCFTHLWKLWMDWYNITWRYKGNFEFEWRISHLPIGDREVPSWVCCEA